MSTPVLSEGDTEVFARPLDVRGPQAPENTTEQQALLAEYGVGGQDS